jgi:aryl-alcohol dehydrogenase-like predicted oxidoreductase
MGLKPLDPSNSGLQAADEAPSQAEARRLRSSRRQFVVGVSGVLVGTAACTDESDGGAGSGGSGSGGAATGGSGGAVTGGNGGAVTGGSGGAATGGNGGAVTGGAPVAGSGGSAGAGAGLRKAASDQVMLGSTGIRVSRLAMGSGTKGSGRSSDQSKLGVEQFSSLLSYGYDQQGITFFETADAYGAHRHIGEAIRRVGRQNVVVLTKISSEDAAGAEADLARFREELGIDMIDIVLLHVKTSSKWTTECEGAMSALAKAKQSGAIRAHGVSCHSIEALRLAAAEPWVDVDLARVNPAGVIMDAEPATVISVLREMKTAGKGVIGMKILGEGQLANNLDMAIKHAVDLDAIDAFTIGFTSETQLDQVAQKIAAV